MNIFGLNVIDVVIVLLILCAGIVGMKRGVFKELVMTTGYLILIGVSLFLKNPIAEFLSLNLPFFNFGGEFEGIVVLNIILYQLLAFILVFALLRIIFNIVLYVTKVLEKILNLTIILGFFSKVLGLIVGLLEGYILMFLLCCVLTLPFFNQSVVKESKLKDKILHSTPVFSDVMKGLTKSVDEIVKLTETDIVEDKDEFNREAIEIMLEHKLITADYVEKLVDAEKITTPGVPNIIDKYK